MVLSDEDASVLRRALEQLAGLLDELDRDMLLGPTPCQQWTVQDLVDHIVAAPAKLARMLRGESIDWSAPTPAAGNEPARAFRSLAAAVGRSTGDLGPEVAARGLAFMHATPTENNRSPAFGPEQPAPAGADAYQRIAAFAGRS